MIELNKELYRQAYQQYQQASEWKATQRLNRNKKLSAVEAWRQYVDLVGFCQLLCPSQVPRQRAEKFIMLETYYARIRQLESWRQQHGKTA